MQVDKLYRFLIIILCSLLVGCTKKEDLVVLSNIEAVDDTTEELSEKDMQMLDVMSTLPMQDVEEIGVSDSVSAETSNMDNCDEHMTIFVHICGAVVCPNVYELEAGSRVFEAIQAAGGFREDACEDYVNQAQILVDGMKLMIPTMEEVELGEFASQLPNDSESTVACVESTVTESGLVNINEADVATLCTLNGIGETRAKQIVAYRESNGVFQNIEDIKLVDGIKDGTFQKIRDQICVK